MFDRATIVNPNLSSDGSLDIGQIVNALVYYRNVELILDGRTFSSMCNQIGFDDFSRLLDIPSLKVDVSSEMPGVMTERRGFSAWHKPVFFRASKKKIASKSSIDDAVHMQSYLKSRGIDYSIGDIKGLLKKCNIVTYGDILREELSDRRIFNDFLEDKEFLKKYICIYAEAMNYRVDMDALKRLDYTVYFENSGYIMADNMNFKDIFIDSPDLNWGNVFVSLHDYRTDLYLSRARSSDIICSESTYRAANSRIELTLQRALRTKERINTFEEVNMIYPNLVAVT